LYKACSSESQERSGGQSQGRGREIEGCKEGGEEEEVGKEENGDEEEGSKDGPRESQEEETLLSTSC